MSRPVTKGELNKLAAGVVRLEGRVESMEERLVRRMDAGFNRIATMIDYYTGQFHKLDRRQIITDRRIDELEKRVSALEKRPC